MPKQDVVTSQRQAALPQEGEVKVDELGFEAGMDAMLRARALVSAWPIKTWKEELRDRNPKDGMRKAWLQTMEKMGRAFLDAALRARSPS